MKISAAFREAFRAYSGHMGDSLKFLVVEACITLAAFAPVLFLTNEKLMGLALLAVPFYLLLVLWARVNAAAAMRDALNDGRLFTYQLIEPDGYGKKLAYGLKRTLMLLFWSIPMTIWWWNLISTSNPCPLIPRPLPVTEPRWSAASS